MKHFLIVFCLLFLQANALVLEDIKDLEDTLSHKKAGYFVGSFDPLHKAHIAIVESCLEENALDYVLIHPVWGKDPYKTRSDIAIRLNMLFSTFETHPKVLVSRLTPKALQDLLTKPISKTHVGPRFEGMQFIGIMGSDTALYLHPNPETSSVYMTGLKISREYEEHTWGSCMALPVQSFIVALRYGDEIGPLKGMIRERPIIYILENKKLHHISSTALKIALKQGNCIRSVTTDPIIKIIDEHELYQE